MINRQEYNKKILSILTEEINKSPELRFIQILWFLNIVDNTDRFYEEPNKTLEKINERIVNNERNDL